MLVNQLRWSKPLLLSATLLSAVCACSVNKVSDLLSPSTYLEDQLKAEILDITKKSSGRYSFDIKIRNNSKVNICFPLAHGKQYPIALYREDGAKLNADEPAENFGFTSEIIEYGSIEVEPSGEIELLAEIDRANFGYFSLPNGTGGGRLEEPQRIFAQVGIVGFPCYYRSFDSAARARAAIFTKSKATGGFVF